MRSLLFTKPIGYNFRKFFTVIVWMGFFTQFLMAQQSLHTAGGEAVGSGGSVSFSVGQVFFQSHESGSGSVSEGVQQPYEIFVVTSLDELLPDQIELTAYPNPVQENLILRVENLLMENLTYHLFDMNGRLVKSERIISSETAIAMADLVPAIYFLRVSESNKELILFKIIKK